jgi:hypothetical protein
VNRRKTPERRRLVRQWLTTVARKFQMKNARGSAPPQMSAAEFAAALKTHGFRVVRAKIEDATGQCPGIRWSAVLRGAAVDRNRTLAKILQERDAEVPRRAIKSN